MTKKKIQRVRDPVHNLITFGVTEFEQMLWRLIQTSPFQRLRRIRQLGFSELVYPGATHTRFAHSLGAFHTARQLIDVAARSLGEKTHGMQEALTAALLHDVGHGMFSHAFEEIGRKLNLKMAQHEHVSSILIRENPEIQKAVGTGFGSSFLSDVANVIESEGASNLYHSVVSSQFDGDRLDYMQRDRLMTGVQSSGIDFSWLINNLELAEIPVGVDEVADETVTTFVLSPKAVHAAEAYVLSLFQLYPTVYFHKATRGVEKLFSKILLRIAELQKDGLGDKTGLGSEHPIVRFFANSNDIENALALDDTVFWGALSELKRAKDKQIAEYASRLSDRKLLKCFDVLEYMQSQMGLKKTTLSGNRQEVKDKIVRIQPSVKSKVEEWITDSIAKDGEKLLLLDDAKRDPYKKFSESKGALNQIYVRPTKGQAPRDLVEVSSIVTHLEPFQLLRVYCTQELGSNTKHELEEIINTIINKEDI